MATASLTVSAVPPLIFKYQQVGTPDNSTTAGLAYGLSLSSSDLIVYSRFALKNGATTSYSITVSTNGNFVIEALGDSSSMAFYYFIYDKSTSDYGLTGTYTVNAGTSISSTIAIAGQLIAATFDAATFSAVTMGEN